MTGIIDLASAEDPQEAIQQAVRILSEGGIVALPDECGLVIAGLSIHEGALKRLLELRPHWKSGVAAVSLPHVELIDDYAQDSIVGGKLTSRCLPGPLVIQLPVDASKLSSAWSEEAARWCSNGTKQNWSFTVPADDTQQSVLKFLPAPLLTLTVSTRGVLPTTPIGGADLTLVGAAPRFDGVPTVVSVASENWHVVQGGVLSERLLKRQLCDVFLFVCTGNTCRSPMAEGLFRKMVAERMQCREEDLIDHGILAASAGLATRGGSPASREAVQLLLDEDTVDLRDHASQPVTEDLLFRADLVVAMTAAHRDAIITTFPELVNRTRLMSPVGVDISDPYGGSVDEYRSCRDEIRACLEQLLDELESEIPPSGV